MGLQAMTHTKLRLNNLLAWRDVGGQVVVISPSESTIHELNDTASFIWKQIHTGLDEPEIMRAYESEYGLSTETAREDLQEFISCLYEKGLLLRGEMGAHA